MTTFQDGPAAGKVLDLARAPLLLRVVIDDAGTVDALDQLSDSPRVGEKVYVYRLVSNDGSVHVCGTKNGRRWGATLQRTVYRLHEQQPDDKAARWTTDWQRWATEQAAKSQG